LIDLIDCNLNKLNNLVEKLSNPATEPNEAPAIIPQPEATTPMPNKQKLVPDCKGTLSVSKNDVDEMKFKRSKIEKADNTSSVICARAIETYEMFHKIEDNMLKENLSCSIPFYPNL